MLQSRGKSTAQKRFCKCFILQVTTVYLQAVFDPAKMFCIIFANIFGVKRFKNIFRCGYWLHVK